MWLELILSSVQQLTFFSKVQYILIGRIAAKRKAPLQSYIERDSSGRRGWSVSLTGQVAGQILGGSSETLAQTVGEPLQPGARRALPASTVHLYKGADTISRSLLHGNAATTPRALLLPRLTLRV